MQQGYYRPNLQKDYTDHARKCDSCERHADVSPQSFQKWGLDILGPLPIVLAQKKFLIIGSDYFSKWIKAKPLAHIQECDI